jgi:hypothetical protein
MLPEVRPRMAPVTQSLLMPQDMDYVAGFQDLAQLSIEFRRTGPTVPLLLRKAHLELRVGSYEQARIAATDALIRNSRSAEAHWLHALSLLGLCLVDLGLITEGPGESKPDRDEPPLDQLEDVHRCLGQCVRLTHGADQEAAHLMEQLQTVLAARPSRRQLRVVLRCLV